ncbi:aspartate carbamoyltransferase [miscellaneous Crenarchaeota group archaeon SMTZ-80]|nr:MAG: aspartate carbamoyltransferase [miscellaneous Crenarchaeota group archaeon SMTZ-80]
MNFEGRDIVSIKDFSKAELERIMSVSDLMEPLSREGSDILKGKIMATLFFEPSTRTRISFESAMLRLGGNYIGFTEPKLTSVEKGENLADTVRVVENYANLIILRHPLEGAARLVSEFVNIPIINAGSGAEEHPTQALLDLYTIKREMGKIDKLKIALIGDLRYGRTVHSLAYALSLFDVKLYLISPDLLKMRKEVLEEINGKIEVFQETDLKKVLPKLDVIYMTRIQKERFPDLKDYELVKGSYRLSRDDLKFVKRKTIVMHPLPRIDEITFDVDNTHHARYFKQAFYGLLVRMALLSLILGGIK